MHYTCDGYHNRIHIRLHIIDRGKPASENEEKSGMWLMVHGPQLQGLFFCSFVLNQIDTHECCKFCQVELETRILRL